MLTKAYICTEPTRTVRLTQPAMYGGHCFQPGDVLQVTEPVARRMEVNGKIEVEPPDAATRADGSRPALLNPVRRPLATSPEEASCYDTDPIATTVPDGHTGPHHDEIAIPAVMLDPKVTARLTVPPVLKTDPDAAGPPIAKPAASPKPKDKDV